jgi:hypothetical protein
MFASVGFTSGFPSVAIFSKVKVSLTEHKAQGRGTGISLLSVDLGVRKG